MTIKEFDAFVRSRLPLEEFEKVDASANGIQVDRENQTLKKIVFSVDACLESFRRAAEQKADLLFVHHGLFWGKVLRVEGVHYRRLKYLLDHDIALYAVHLPLDMHPEIGNNAGLAEQLGLEAKDACGEYKGKEIGIKGRLPVPLTVDEAAARLFSSPVRPLGKLPFGPEKIESVGIISGGAPFEVMQAVEEGLDCYITGDASHSIYHFAMEAGINVIFGGHYETEIWGVKNLSRLLTEETGIETEFIDVPTGL